VYHHVYMDLITIARRYLETLAALGPVDGVLAFFAPDAVIEILPNKVTPNGHTGGIADARVGYEKGRLLFRSQNFVVRNMILSGDQVAGEVEWSGVLAAPFRHLAAGEEMRAYFALFLKFREGKIISQRNYDCYPPF
jgi:ketosteroid isomerase-like protein